MTALLRHGLLLGAAAGAAWIAIEILAGGVPLRETAEAAGWFPAYVMLGAAAGLVAALLARVASPSPARERAPGLQLLATTAALLLVAVAWLPGAIAGQPPGAARSVLVIGSACALHLLGGAAAASRPAWLFASFASPAAAASALLALCAAALVARHALPAERGVGAPEPGAAAGGGTNLVVVVLEGVPAASLGAYGSFRAATPTLDALAQESVVFEQAFAAASDHDAALRGLLAGTGLAEGLAARDYATWGGSTTAAETALAGFAAREDASRPRLAARLALARATAAVRGGAGGAGETGETELAARALQWLAARDPGRPFGMVLHLPGTGAPYEPPRELRERFRPQDLDERRFDEIRRAQTDAGFRAAERGERAVGDEEARALRALQDAELLAADALVKKLTDELRRAELLESTLLVIVSDHGSRFGEDGGRLGCAGSAHDSALRIPLILRLPSALPASARAKGLVSASDLVPGLLALLDGAPGSILERAAAGEVPRAAIAAGVEMGGRRGTVARSATEKFLLDPDGALLAAGEPGADPAEDYLRRPLADPERREAAAARAQLLLRDARSAPVADGAGRR